MNKRTVLNFYKVVSQHIGRGYCEIMGVIERIGLIRHKNYLHFFTSVRATEFGH